MGTPSITSARVLRVTTRCRTVDEFITSFSRLVDDRSILLLTHDRLPIGHREPFAIELADGTPVLRGEAEVAESSPPPDGGLRLQFVALDDAARAVHQRMLRRGPAPPPPSSGTTRMFGLAPPRALAPAFPITRWTPLQHDDPLDHCLTIRMPPLFPEPVLDLDGLDTAPVPSMVARTTRHRPLRPAAAHPGWLIVVLVAVVLLATVALLAWPA